MHIVEHMALQSVPAIYPSLPDVSKCGFFGGLPESSGPILLLIELTNLSSIGTKTNKVIKWVAGYCAIGYVVTIVLFLGVWCRPITQYWQVPVDDTQCASYYNEIITSAVLNISSDAMILLVPVPVLVKLQLPIKRKIILGTVFSLGVLTVLTAILNRYYNFSSPYGSLVYLYWYVAESSTSVYVSNIPLCWPVLRRLFQLDAFSAAGRTKGSANLTSDNHFSLNTNALRGDRPIGRAEEGWQRTDSEERIVGNFHHGATPWNGADIVVGTTHSGDFMSDDVELADVNNSSNNNYNNNTNNDGGGMGKQANGYVVSNIGTTNDDEKKKEGTEWHRNEHTDIVKTVDIDQWSSSSRSPT